jgi:hypothetical protein
MSKDSQSSNPWYFKKRYIALLIIILYFISTLTNSTDDSTEATKSSLTQTRSYPVKYLSHADINPALVSVRFSITNNGTQPITPSCKIKMQDSSGVYKGFDYFDITDPITAGQSKQVVVQLTITKEGALFVDQFTGDCTAETSDTGTSSGTEVIISDIEDFSATDASEGWYWGASFKANQQPMTQMDCVVKAMDKNNKVIGETSYRANTLNDGTVIGYGSDAKSLVDSTKSMVLAIKSFDVKCTL